MKNAGEGRRQGVTVGPTGPGGAGRPSVSRLAAAPCAPGVLRYAPRAPRSAAALITLIHASIAHHKLHAARYSAQVQSRYEVQIQIRSTYLTKTGLYIQPGLKFI